MLQALWLLPTVPLASATFLMFFGRRAGHRASAVLGVASIGVAAALSLLVLADLLELGVGAVSSQRLWSWLAIGPLDLAIGFRLDALSATMIATVSVVAFFIHLYSVEHMAGDEGIPRFFAFMNLFVAAMLTLVLADNLLLLYLGWEGVGLCSYLLIGFWYREPANGRAARKAFLVTRVGDTAMMIGLLLLFTSLGTLDIASVLERAPARWAVGGAPAVAAAFLLLGGAVGKSAQLPLQTWLPDAMAGPTPTSALIHAATMVTAGVYLIARMHTLFTLAPIVQLVVAIVGAVTLLVAGVSALFQSDLKRILAYSTMSQIGYMFLALGVGAWSAAVFHLMTHAFFKALLFLAAGVVIEAMHDEHDIAKMGGLRRRLPLAFAGFVIGGAALAGLPLLTSGYYSKDLILWETWATGRNPLFWVAGMLGVLLTTLYIMRLILYVFAGPERSEIQPRAGWPVRISIGVLAVLAIVGGFINFHIAGRGPLFTSFLETVLPATTPARHGLTEITSALSSAALIALGLVLAFALFLRKRAATEALAGTETGAALHDFWKVGWGFDWLYARLFVLPILWLARVGRGDVLDSIYTALAALTRFFHRALSRTESGRLRSYATGIAIGALILLVWVLVP
jgi:NADH-quinone oxidoreductase subunit L